MIAIKNIEMVVSPKNKAQVEKMIALFNVGVVDSLESGLITMEDAIRCFYGQFRLKELKAFRPEVESIVVAGLELLDLRDIFPEKYEQLWKDQYKMLRGFSEQILKNEQVD